MKQVIVDVREKDEFEAEHVKESVHVPLSSFASQAPGILEQIKDQEIVLMCRSGKRAQLARDQIAAMGFDLQCQVYKGGILAWKKQGGPTVATRKNHFPILRQVQIVAGFLVLMAVIAAFSVDIRFAALAGFVGAGLLFAGITGQCLMAELLAKMPWNKRNPTKQKELCEVSPSSTSCNK